jgi:hypothetical protein
MISRCGRARLTFLDKLCMTFFRRACVTGEEFPCFPITGQGVTEEFLPLLQPVLAPGASINALETMAGPWVAIVPTSDDKVSLGRNSARLLQQHLQAAAMHVPGGHTAETAAVRRHVGRQHSGW